MKGPGALALMAMLACAPTGAWARSPRIEERLQFTEIKASPDGRHLARFTRRGLQLDGRLIDSGPGPILGQVTWRRDSRALAFLQRSPRGLQLVVLPRLDSESPLTWLLPLGADGLSKVFWVGPSRIGVGAKELVPRFVVSWRTVVRTPPASW